MRRLKLQEGTMKQVTLLCLCALVCAFGVSAAKIEVQDEVRDEVEEYDSALNARPVRKEMVMLIDDSGMYKQKEDMDPDIEKFDPSARSMNPRPEERQFRPVINSITDRGSESMAKPEYQRRGDKNDMALVNNRGPITDQRPETPGYGPPGFYKPGFGPPGSNIPRFTPNGPNSWPQNWKRHCKKHHHHRHHHHHHHGEENEGEDKVEESLIFSKNCVPQNKIVIISDEIEQNKKRMDNECKETCISRNNKDIYDILNTDLNVDDSIVIIAGTSSYPHNISCILNRINALVEISTRTNIFISTIPIKEDESDDVMKNYIKGVNELTRKTLKNYPSIRLLDLEVIHRDLMKFSPEDWGKSQICLWINDNLKSRTSVYSSYTQSSTTDKVSVLLPNNNYDSGHGSGNLLTQINMNNEKHVLSDNTAVKAPEVPFDISIIFDMSSAFDEEITKLTNEQSIPLTNSKPNADFILSSYSIKNPWLYNRDNWMNTKMNNSLPLSQVSETVRYEDENGIASDDYGNPVINTDAEIIPTENLVELFDDAFKLLTDTTEIKDHDGWAIDNQVEPQVEEEEVSKVENSPEMIIFDV